MWGPVWSQSARSLPPQNADAGLALSRPRAAHGDQRGRSSGQRADSRHLVNAQPMRRSSSCLASTDSASLWSGSPRRAMAAQMSVSVMELNLARNTVFSPPWVGFMTGSTASSTWGRRPGGHPPRGSVPPALCPACETQLLSWPNLAVCDSLPHLPGPPPSPSQSRSFSLSTALLLHGFFSFH